jgi:hypothetical protein
MEEDTCVILSLLNSEFLAAMVLTTIGFLLCPFGILFVFLFLDFGTRHMRRHTSRRQHASWNLWRTEEMRHHRCVATSYLKNFASLIPELCLSFELKKCLLVFWSV